MVRAAHGEGSAKEEGGCYGEEDCGGQEDEEDGGRKPWSAEKYTEGEENEHNLVVIQSLPVITSGGLMNWFRIWKPTKEDFMAAGLALCQLG